MSAISTPRPLHRPTPVASNESLCLPPGYRQQPANLTLEVNRGGTGAYWAPWRLAENRKWQFHVYAWAAELVRTRGLGRVLDIGCGPCVKLMEHLLPLTSDITGLDQNSALAAARQCGATFDLVEVDLEQPEFRPARPFDLIVCADVIEHLADPDPAIELMRRCAGPKTVILISTPERLRERGRACMASNKPEHVREWSREEFGRFLASRGLKTFAHRLLPKNDAPRDAVRDQELAWRKGERETSPWCCQAWACRIASNPGA